MTSPSKDSPVLSLPQGSSGAPEDPFRAMLSTLIHETLEREFAQFLGARRFERSPERRDVRNGYRRRQFTTRRCTSRASRRGRSRRSSSDARRDDVKQGLSDVWNAPSRAEAERRVQGLLQRWHQQLPKLASWLESSIAETLAVFALRDPVAHRRLRSTNGIEHDHMAVRPERPSSASSRTRRARQARQCARDGAQREVAREALRRRA